MTKLKLFIVVLCSFICGLAVSAVSQEKSLKPIRIDTTIPYSEMSTDFPAWPKEDIISGESIHRYKTLHSGDITVELYEADPLKLKIVDFPIDEFVTVVSGKLILTSIGEESQHFEVGDSVLVPKGFTGIWEMQGNFRELIAFKNE
ncbi:MAG: cupin domain-containing protein [Emcibacteraceae bacterium]|nr:cupin domain-containing protein [Emcibacteraceae bacterium]